MSTIDFDDAVPGEIVIPMTKKRDKEGREYMFGTPELPISIPCEQCFFIAFYETSHPCLIVRRKHPKRVRTRNED